MPTLDWIGKEKVINHHLDIPYQVLERKYSFDIAGMHEEDNNSKNKIIHGDNLSALKSLLPQYEGQIKCIYIDPPYNTGNEGWSYNDNVNAPHILKWLGEVVGKEGEDLSRHDKWLCMMYPRLRLLQRLLKDDGVIFISVDDNEMFNLKMMCDEIFGANCFVANISWQRTYSQRNDTNGIAVEVEYILVYGKNALWQPKRLARTEEMNSAYKNPDNDPKGEWSSVIATAPSASTHQGMVYAIQHPMTGEMMYPSKGRCWPYQQEQMLKIMNEWCPYELKELNDQAERSEVCGVDVTEVRKGVLGIVLVEEKETSARIAREKYDNGVWPELFFTKSGEGSMRRKTYINKVAGRVVTNYWAFDEVGHTDEAKKEIKSIFDGKNLFDTPKPVRLIDRIINLACDDGDIILDCFAGSGTTAHAALCSEKNISFILVEMGNYANTVTAERVKRVINGYGEGKTKIQGSGGDFSYYELGECVLLADGSVNHNISKEEFRKYIWYEETKTYYKSNESKEEYLLGLVNSTAYYLMYEKDSDTILDASFLCKIKTNASYYVIYADKCLLSSVQLQKYGITFKKIPRDIIKM